jgi:hypothetical protein
LANATSSGNATSCKLKSQFLFELC